MSYELIITGKTVLTMADGAAPLEDGAVAVVGGLIAAVGPAAEIRAAAGRARVIDVGDGIVLPGFVNTHTHLAMTLMRGLADDLRLKEWLEKHIWPAEARVMSGDNVALGSRLAAAESLLAGVTCICDQYFHAERVIEAVTGLGLRAVVAEALIDFPTPSSRTPEEALGRQRDLLDRFRQHPLVISAVAPHTPYSVSAPNLVKEAELAEEYGALLLIHVAETRWEVDTITAEKGVSPVTYLADLGVLSERTVAAHCVHVTEEDLDTLLEFDVAVSSNPVSNLKLASGIAPLPQMLSKGLRVGLGTDGAASNNTLDLLRDAQLAALMYKGLTKDPTCMPARQVVELLTRGGASALGLGDRLGSLEPGKKADIVCLATEQPRAFPRFDAYSHIAYAARAADVAHVVVDGRVVVEDGRLLTADVAELRRAVHAAVDERR